MYAEGSPGTWETWSSPRERSVGGPKTKPQARRRCAARRRERTSDAREVPPSEGNEARREGRSGVGAPRSTAEAGELAPRDPAEGRRCRSMGRRRERWQGHRALKPSHRNSNGSRSRRGRCRRQRSRPWLTPSISTFSKRRTDAPARTAPWASTARRPRRTRSTWRRTSGRCSSGPSRERIGPRPCGGCTSRRQVGPRPARSGSRPSRTRSCSAPWRWCSRPSMSRTFGTARTAFDPVVRHTKRCKPCGRG